MALLTICIPTYRRIRKAIYLALSLREAFSSETLEILFVLDATDDSLPFESETSLTEKAIEIIKHGKNRGLESAFLTCLERAKTPFALICPDDDVLYPSAINELILRLERDNSDLIVTDWIGLDGKRMRKINSENRLSLHDIPHFTNHATGLVYRVPARLHLYELLKENDSYKSLRLFFPQVLFAYLVYLNGGTLNTSNIVLGGYSVEGPESSDLTDSSGYSYIEPNSVLAISLETIRFLESRCDDSQLKRNAQRELTLHLTSLRYRLFTTVYWSIYKTLKNSNFQIQLGLLRAFISSLVHFRRG